MRTWWWACSSRSAQFETLPKGELSFMLSTDPDPKNIPNTGYVLAIVLIVLAIAVPVLLVAAVVVIFVVAYKRAKDNKGHN